LSSLCHFRLFEQSLIESGKHVAEYDNERKQP